MSEVRGYVKSRRPGWYAAATLTVLIVEMSCLDSQVNEPLPIATLTVLPGPAALHVGQAAQFRVVAKNSSGAVLATLPPISWSSSDSGVIAIAADGVGIGRAVGHANVIATGQGITANAVVTVTPGDPRPNIIMIITDDARTDDMQYLPKIQRLLVQQGISFTNFFITTSTCCPSRSSILRGQYAHNHQTLSNVAPAGSFLQFRALGNEQSTIATWLEGAGYRTALFGKYLNKYPGYPNPDPTYVPPGWNEWAAVFAPDEGDPAYYGYLMSQNGQQVGFGFAPQDYLTDVLSHRATQFVRESQFLGIPFFLYLAPFAPHTPPTPSVDHTGAEAALMAPRSPAFNEADVSDKWLGVRDLPLMTDSSVANLDSVYRRRIETLLSVDDMVEALVDTLTATGALNNTYIILLSDNGLELGEHRLVLTKETPYEESIRVPLMIRGPRIAPGTQVSGITLNIDLAPTIAELAGVVAPPFVDGRSLVPFFGGGTPAWRHAFAEEIWAELAVASPRLSFEQIRTDDFSYIEFFDGEKELYDLRTDPFELQSIYKTAPAGLVPQLSGWLHELRSCSGVGCRTVDVAP